MAAAPPPPQPPKAHRDGGDAPVTLFLDTDLGTRLALLVAPDTTIRGLKCTASGASSPPLRCIPRLPVGTDPCIGLCSVQVDAEHAAAFPDLGPVAAKSFQVLCRGSEVRRKGVLYHLSDSMTVTSAFTKIKGGCFLHVKMTEAEAVARCCQDDGRRSSDGHLGIHVEKRIQELRALTSEIACDGLPQMLEGDAAVAALIDVQAHDALPSSSQLNTEIKTGEALGPSDTQAGCDPAIEKAKSYKSQIANQTEGPYISFTSMENVDKPTNQSNISHVMEKVHATKEILHGDGDNDVGGSVSDCKEVSIQEQMLAEIHAMDNLSQEKEHKKSRTDNFDTPAPDPPRITNEFDVGDWTKSVKDPLETETTDHREPINTSFQQEVQHTLHEDSTENPITVGKKKRKRRQLAPFKASAEETNEPSDVAKEYTDFRFPPYHPGDAYDVETTGELVQFMHDAQASTAIIFEQRKSDHALKECRNLSIGDAINSAPEVVASEVGNPKGSITSWNGEDKNEQIKHGKGSHDDGVGEIKDMDKDGKSTDALEKRQINDNTSQLKKHKKAKKVSSVHLVSVDTTHEKEMHGYRENAARSDTVSSEREIVHDPSKQHISINVHQGNSDIIASPNGDGKKKKRRRRSESSKVVDPSQDLTKSSEFVANESSMHFTDGTLLDARKTTPGGIEGATIIDHKDLGENLAVQDVIDEVSADLRSKDSSSKDLDEDMLTGETHLGSNKNALELPESAADEVGVSAALPPKYPAAIHSDAPASSPRLMKSNEEKLKLLSTMIDSSHHSCSTPKEDANRELNESESLRFSDSDPKDILTGDVIAQVDGKSKATKRKRKVSVKQVPADNGKTLDEQVSHVDTLDLKGANATEANLVQAGSVVDTPLITVSGKVKQKDRRSSKIRTAEVQETNGATSGLDSDLAKDSQCGYANDVIRTHNNENAAGTATETPVVQKDGIALKSSSPNAQKASKVSLNSELQSWDHTLEHGSSAELGNLRSEENLIRPKDSSEPNFDGVVHPDAINFLDHFSSSKMSDPPVSVEHKQKDEDECLREMKNKRKIKRKKGTGSIEPNDALESLLPADKSSLTGHFGTSSVIAPSVGAEKMNIEDKNVKNTKEKKRKRKVDMEMPVAEKEIPNCDNQGTDIATQESHLSFIQKGRMGLDNGKERSSKVTQNNSIVPYEPVDAALEKKLQQNAVDQNKLLTDKDHEDINKGVRKSSSKIKPHAKSKHDESIKGSVASNPKPERNFVKDFSTSPRVSSDSAEVAPQNANRYRVAVRKVPSKRYEKTREKSKKENRKVVSGTIFNDNNNEGSDDDLDIKDDLAFMEASPDNSATSGDSGRILNEIASQGIGTSWPTFLWIAFALWVMHLTSWGISSAAYDDSDVPDDDGTMSLSQKSLKDGLHIGSILRGSRSYKKARRKQSELLDDDTVVPDSQPADGLWD
ncbi:hypothetical protein HU200_032311 [Digitaria exilis]|uniref:Uncharacterized protein n=1 Tax=Digitaria exilis TaxID=1010633 RepID=A0A835BZN1_9POAL|nr:hypothetical protein HU200_032311 [Digitaria exilis]